MRSGDAWRAAVATAALGALLIALPGCGGPGPEGRGGTETGAAGNPADSRQDTDPTRIPDVGDRLQRRISADTRQVVAVYGEGRNSAESTVVLYTRHGATWERTGNWPAHNGKKGLDHEPSRG